MTAQLLKTMREMQEEVARWRAGGRRCCCDGPRWLRAFVPGQAAPEEPPPALCWQCGGRNPPGVVVRVEEYSPGTEEIAPP